jgi:hypothetical protein
MTRYHSRDDYFYFVFFFNFPLYLKENGDKIQIDLV